MKQAISKKEETLNSLRQQKEVGFRSVNGSYFLSCTKDVGLIFNLRYVLQSAEKRADHLEFLLHEQRKKLLT